MRRMLCILTIAAIVLIGTVAATPVLPDEFYGSVYLNGNPAPAGTVIAAKINGETRGNFTTTETGVYGSPGNFDPKLRVVATEEEVNSGNATITFFVGGVQAFQTVLFKGGTSPNTRLDLLANDRAFVTDTTGSATYASSGGTIRGSVSPASGTGTGTTSGSAIPGTAVITPAPTESRSSIYYNIDDRQTIPATTVIATTAATPSPVITTVPTTKKAGVGPLSVVFLVASIIALLCVVGRADDTRKRR